jgi:hypothetical protein
MLMHLVCFKYRPEVAEAEREEHRNRLRSLADLDQVIDLWVGADVVRAARSYDTGLVVSFHDRRALDAYQVEPRHVVVAQFGVARCEHVVAVDFEF